MSDFLSIFTLNDTTSGRRLKITTDPSDGSDILTNSDPSGGRRVKVDLTGSTGFVASLTNSGTGTSGMARTGKTVSQLVADVPAYAIVKRKVDLLLGGGEQSQAARAVEAVKRAYAGEKLDVQDGVRVDFAAKRAWLHVRGSNTEPIMRLIAEAPTEGEAGAILDEAAGVIAKG